MRSPARVIPRFAFRCESHSAHINLIWSPVAGSDVGVEYVYADRETEDGLNGHLKRLQASAKYAF